MELMDAIKTRQSIRQYTSQPVEREKLLRIIEAGRLAPSAKNEQEWRFIIVEDTEIRKKLGKAACNQKFVGEAPVVIIACAESDGRVMYGGQRAYPIDVAIAIDHITLKAVEEGLGTCWIGAFDADAVREIISMPKHFYIVELVTLGYPAKIPKPRPRKHINEVLRFEQWVE